ncbi:MAG: beta-ketoacyl-ACP synthase III [Planctomycetota bacterium]
MTTGPGRPARPAGVQIMGTGAALPDNVVTNDDLADRVATSDEWIVQRTGIRQRRLADDDTRTSDLAAEAVAQALQAARVAPDELDLLILATMTPDTACPATACTVAAKVGAIPCGAFDMNIACTGYVAALNMASNAVESGHYRHVAVVAADKLSSIVDWSDRRTCILFGDAASACVVGPSNDPQRGCLYQSLGADGVKGEALYIPHSERDLPDFVADPAVTTEAGWNGAYGKLQMNGGAVYKFAVKVLAESVEQALDATGLTADDIKMVVPHQSNIRMLQSSWKRLGFPEEKVKINIDRFGNTSAASCGICLHECMEEGLVGPGDHVIFVAQGGGLSWGSALWRL